MNKDPNNRHKVSYKGRKSKLLTDKSQLHSLISQPLLKSKRVVVVITLKEVSAANSGEE